MIDFKDKRLSVLRSSVEQIEKEMQFEINKHTASMKILNNKRKDLVDEYNNILNNEFNEKMYIIKESKNIDILCTPDLLSEEQIQKIKELCIGYDIMKHNQFDMYIEEVIKYLGKELYWTSVYDKDCGCKVYIKDINDEEFKLTLTIVKDNNEN